MAKAKQQNFSPTVINRRAEHEYFFLETFTAGVVLTGTEVKSIRLGKVQLQDAFCFFQANELFIRNMQISPYEKGNIYNHDPKRARKLLLTKRELKKLKTKLEEKGLTIIPIQIHFNERNIAKLDIALAKGKKYYDKRETLKAKESQRDVQRSLAD